MIRITRTASLGFAGLFFWVQVPLQAAGLIGRVPGFEVDGQVEVVPASFFTVALDNDVITSSGDKFYTNGIKVESGFDAAPWDTAQWMFDRSVFARVRERHRLAVGQLMFTPSNIGETNLQILRADRPYSGWLFAGYAIDYFIAGAFGSAAARSALSMELQAGALGRSSHAHEMQSAVHYLIRMLTHDSKPIDPRGWDINYVGASGPGINARLRAQSTYTAHRASFDVTGSALGVSLSPELYVDLGNVYDDVGAGVIVKAGLIGVSLPSVQGVITIEPNWMASEQGRQAGPSFPLEVYGMVGVIGRLVAYNLFLDGDVCTDSPDGKPLCQRGNLRKQLFVGDLMAGIGFRWKIFDLAVSAIFRSSEVKGAPPASLPHEFGDVRLSFLY